jgi:hypothetical protein
VTVSNSTVASMLGERKLVCDMVFDRLTAIPLRSIPVAVLTRSKPVAAIARCLAVATLVRVPPITVATRRTATASRLGVLTSRAAIESAARPTVCPVAVADSARKCAKTDSGALLTACAAVDFHRVQDATRSLPQASRAANPARGSSQFHRIARQVCRRAG